MIQPWIDTNRVRFLALSPHVADFFKERASGEWGMTKVQGTDHDLGAEEFLRVPDKEATPWLLPPFAPVMDPSVGLSGPEMEAWASAADTPFAAIPVTCPFSIASYSAK